MNPSGHSFPFVLPSSAQLKPLLVRAFEILCPTAWDALLWSGSDVCARCRELRNVPNEEFGLARVDVKAGCFVFFLLVLRIFGFWCDVGLFERFENKLKKGLMFCSYCMFWIWVVILIWMCFTGDFLMFFWYKCVFWRIFCVF
jgi:hypothetical protein